MTAEGSHRRAKRRRDRIHIETDTNDCTSNPPNGGLRVNEIGRGLGSIDDDIVDPLYSRMILELGNRKPVPERVDQDVILRPHGMVDKHTILPWLGEIIRCTGDGTRRQEPMHERAELPRQIS